MSEHEQAIWASLPMPGVVIDGSDMIVRVNPATEQFLTASAKTICGQPVMDRLAIDAPLEDMFKRARQDMSDLFLNKVAVTGGQSAPVECNIRIAPLLGVAGHLLLTIEPGQLADRLGRGNSISAAAKSAIGMAEMLAHEIKNPLAGITGAAQLLSMSINPEDRELTDLIVAESHRIVALLDQVEHFGNLRPPERSVVNIHDLLDRARKSAAVGFASNMEIIEDYDPSLPMTFVDGDQLIQVFSNLLRNASEAAGQAGGKIRLRTFYDLSLRVRHKDGSGGTLPLQIEIIDNGPGLPPDIAEHVFDPFISGRDNGTGLGLALASKILSEHDGWISVDSAPGRTVFRISLPLAPNE